MKYKFSNSLTEYTLEEAVSHLIDYRGKTPKKTNYGIPLVTAKIVKNGRLEPYNEFIDEKDYESWMVRGIPKKGDIVLTVEAPLGEVAQLDDTKIALAQRIVTLRGKEDILDNTYFLYILQSSPMQSQLQSRASGTTVIGIKQSELRKIVLKLPPLPTQKKIAHILSTLDDKIELNRKMNQTLEEMASAIFKSWFVDFDPVHAKANCEGEAELENIAKELGISKAIIDLFPSEFEESELGMIPKGWKWEKITEVCSSIGSGGTPKRMEDNNFNGEINWFTTKELQNSFVLKSIETITEKGLNTSSAKLFPVNTVVMAIYAAPTVGRLGILTEASTFNQAACGFVADEDKISYEFLFLYLQEKNEYLNNLANGAAQQNLNVGIVKNLDVLVANINIIQTFKNITKNIFGQIKINIQQIQALQKTRDTLLPKLLSGEIDVSELKIL